MPVLVRAFWPMHRRLTPRNVHLIVGLAAAACIVMWGGTYDMPLCHAR